MKNIFIRWTPLALVVLVLLSVAGCRKQEPEIDAQAMLEALLLYFIILQVLWVYWKLY